MKKMNLFLMVSIISSFAFAQKAPQLKNAVAGWQSTGLGEPVKAMLSLDGYLKQGTDKCVRMVAEEANKLKNDPKFIQLSQSIGKKLKEKNSNCNHFRFELSEYKQPWGEAYSVDPRFTYRCYKTANMGLPSASVAQAPSVKLNTASYDNGDFKNECNVMNIAKKLKSNLDKEVKDDDDSAKSKAGSPSNTGSESKLRKIKVNN